MGSVGGELKPHQSGERHGRAVEAIVLRYPPPPVVVARGADPERHPVVTSPPAEANVQVQVVADGVEDVGGEGQRSLGGLRDRRAALRAHCPFFEAGHSGSAEEIASRSVTPIGWNVNFWPPIVASYMRPPRVIVKTATPRS